MLPSQERLCSYLLENFPARLHHVFMAENISYIESCMANCEPVAFSMNSFDGVVVYYTLPLSFTGTVMVVSPEAVFMANLYVPLSLSWLGCKVHKKIFKMNRKTRYECG